MIMQKLLIIVLLLFGYLSFGQNKYKQDLDSLNKYFDNMYFTLNNSSESYSLRLISKYHPAYVQTFVGDGTEIVTDKMKTENVFYKTVSKNKKSVIILSSSFFPTWIVIIDLKQLDSNNLSFKNDTIIMSDMKNKFKSNVAHRFWKGYVTTHSVKIFPKKDLPNHQTADKTYSFIKSAILHVR